MDSTRRGGSSARGSCRTKFESLPGQDAQHRTRCSAAAHPPEGQVLQPSGQVCHVQRAPVACGRRHIRVGWQASEHSSGMCRAHNHPVRPCSHKAATSTCTAGAASRRRHTARPLPTPPPTCHGQAVEFGQLLEHRRIDAARALPRLLWAEHGHLGQIANGWNVVHEFQALARAAQAASDHCALLIIPIIQ